MFMIYGRFRKRAEVHSSKINGLAGIEKDELVRLKRIAQQSSLSFELMFSNRRQKWHALPVKMSIPEFYKLGEV